MGKKVLILILTAIFSLLIGFGIGMVVQNGGFSGLFHFAEEQNDQRPNMEGKVVTVGKNTANVYEKADANSEVIYSMSNGETATCIKQSSKWVKLEIIDGIYGYAHVDLFTLAADYNLAKDEEQAAPEEPKDTYVTPTVNVLDLYQEESSDSDIVTTVEYGAVLKMVEQGKTWSKVATLEGKEGFVLTSDIETTNYDPDAVVVEVVHSFVNLRSEPTSDSDKLGSLNEGDTAAYLGEEEGFYHIRTEDGTEGYVSKDYTEMKNTSGTSTENTDETTEKTTEE